MDNIQINGKLFNRSNLTLLYEELGQEEWVKELFNFLDQWFVGCEGIEVSTSGSTGIPKKLLLPRSLMLHSAQATNQFFHLGKDSTMLLVLSAGYIAGKMMILRAIASKCNILVQAPSSCPKLPLDTEIDLLALVPMQLQALLDAGVELKHVNNLIVGGAPMLPELEERVKEYSCHVYATYGMTETASHVALREVGKGQDYYLLPSIHASVDHRSCLRLQSDWFGELQTNDVVSLAEDGDAFQWKGRYDFVINSGGVKIHPEQLERELQGMIPVRFYFTSEPHPQLGEQLVLVLEGTPWTLEQINGLKQELNQRLKPYFRPKQIRFKKIFEETPTGKIKRTL